MGRSTKQSTTRAILVGLAVTAVGVVILFSVSSTTKRGEACKNWPTAKAEITESRINSAHIKKRKHRARVTYTYRVDDQEYVGKRIQFGEMSTSHSKAQAIAKRFPVGKIVDLHYNPEDPEMAVLLTGVGGGLIIVKLVAWIVLVTGVLMIGAIPIDIMRRRRSQQF